jgi:hypothetical protein
MAISTSVFFKEFFNVAWVAIIHRKSQPNLYKLDMKEKSCIIPLYFWLFTETEYKKLVTFPFFFLWIPEIEIFKKNFIFLFFSSQFLFLANLTSREEKKANLHPQ